MKKLVHEAFIVKNNEIVATAPTIAGYYGYYTGHKSNKFSLSYNVRESVEFPTDDMILANLEHTLDPEYIPLWNLIQELLLNQDKGFDEAVEELMTRKVTSPGYVIVGGL